MANRPEAPSQEAIDLAFDVLGISQQLMLVKMRFLKPAFYRLTPVPDMRATLWVDGRELHFSPLHVISRYLQDEKLVARDYLHAVLHCIFQHPFVGRQISRPQWDLACDIAVESLISSLDLDAVRATRQLEQMDLISRLSHEVGALTAERIYRWLMGQNLSAAELEDLSRLFYADDHSPWYPGTAEDADEEEGSDEEQRPQDRGGQQQAEKSQGSDDSDGKGEDEGGQDRQGDKHDQTSDQDQSQQKQDQGPDQDPDPDPDRGQQGPDAGDQPGEGSQTAPGGKGSEDAGRQTGAGGNGAPQRESADQAPARPFPVGDEASDRPRRQQERDDWQNVAKRMQVELETQGAAAGVGTRDLVQAIRALNRERYDYSDFLRRFAVNGEVMAVSPDEFDYLYYTYGLTLYRNMPLIEPLEYREVRRISEFVIALDTSASVQGDLVQRFVEKTFNILKQTESFFTKVKIYVLQCDTQIKDVKVLESVDQVDEFVASLKLTGFGGTDFRPVFSYVDQLLASRTLANLQGLIYFTDGAGTYPQKMPSYKSAFIFLDDGCSDPEVPSWAIKLILDEDDL